MFVSSFQWFGQFFFTIIRHSPSVHFLNFFLFFVVHFLTVLRYFVDFHESNSWSWRFCFQFPVSFHLFKNAVPILPISCHISLAVYSFKKNSFLFVSIQQFQRVIRPFLKQFFPNILIDIFSSLSENRWGLFCDLVDWILNILLFRVFFRQFLQLALNYCDEFEQVWKISDHNSSIELRELTK